MKIAILGGGLTGLTASYYLSKNHTVTVYEKENHLGGLASGFKSENWDWFLDYTYHHIFKYDNDIIDFAKEIGYNDIFFQSPKTCSLYEHENIFKQMPLDTPIDLLSFPLLSFQDKIRSGITLAYLKFLPFQKIYEDKTAFDFMKKFMGDAGWKYIFEELFKKKFGSYANEILASFIWARVKARTKELGYMRGGFQTFTDHIEKKVKEKNVSIYVNTPVLSIEKKDEKFILNFKDDKKEEYDCIISTLPTPIMSKVCDSFFPEDYKKQFGKLSYLWATNLIIETEKPLLSENGTYWLSICIPEMPIMVAVQQTNFISKKNYGGKHITYLGNYVADKDKLLSMNAEETFLFYKPYLEKINKDFCNQDKKLFSFKMPFAQPIFNKTFLECKPDFTTPVKNFFIANLDMTYPYDRGTNFAISLGKRIANLI